VYIKPLFTSDCDECRYGCHTTSVILLNGYWGAVSSGIKLPVIEADRPPPCTKKFKHARSYIPTPPYIFMTRFLNEHTEVYVRMIHCKVQYGTLILRVVRNAENPNHSTGGSSMDQHLLHSVLTLQWLCTLLVYYSPYGFRRHLGRS
jgi:hypothetical protein